MILYELYKYDIYQNTESKIEGIFIDQPAESKLDNKGEKRFTKGTAGVFRYKSMDRENINFNELEIFNEKKEKEFLNSLMVAFP